MPLLTPQQGFEPDPVSPNAQKRIWESLRDETPDEWGEPSGPSTGFGPQSGPTDPQDQPADPSQEGAPSYDAGRGILGNIGTAILRGGADAINETSNFASLLWGDGDFNVIDEEFLDEALPEQGGAYGIVETFSQFTTGFLGVSKFTKPFNMGAKAYKALRGAGAAKQGARAVATGVGAATEGALAGAIVDFAMVDPWEHKTLRALDTAPDALADPARRYIEVGEDERTWAQEAAIWQRTKNAIEGTLWGAALGPTIAGIAYGVKRTGIIKAVRAGRLSAKEGNERLAEALKQKDADAARLSEEEALGIWHHQGESRVMLNTVEGEWVAEPEHFISKAEVEGNRTSIEFDETGQGTPEDIRKAVVGQGYDPAVHTRLFHTTTGRSGVMRLGLLSHNPEGAGLGGPGIDVSTTWRLEHAETIAEASRLRARAANDEYDVTVDEIFGIFDGISERFSEAPLSEDMDGLMSYFGGYRKLSEVLAKSRGIAPTDTDGIERIAKELQADRESVIEALQAGIDDMEWDEFEIIQHLNDHLPAEIRSTSVTDLEDWVGINPDDIDVLQVVARPNAKARIVDTENEIAFRQEDIEVVPRIVAANEAQLAARNKLLYRRMTNGFRSVPKERITKTVAEISRRLEEGVPVDSPELVRNIGMNLGLITKTFDDFKQAHMGFLTENAEAFQRATNRAREGGGVSHLETDDAALQIISEKLFGPGKTLEDARVWFREEFGANVDELPAHLHAAHKVSLIVGQDIAQVARAHELASGLEKDILNTLLMDMVDSFAEIQIRLGSVEANVGRTLNIARLKGQSPAAARARKIEEGLEKGGEDAKEIVDGAAAGRAAGDRQAGKVGLDDQAKRRLARDLRETNGDPELIRKGLIHTADMVKSNADIATKMERVLSFRVNMLLSGPKTHFVNSFNNVVTMFQVPFEYWLGGRHMGDEQLATYGKDLMPSWQDFGDAVGMMMETWRRGFNILDPTHKLAEGTTDPGWLANFGSGAKQVTNAPGRALMAADEFFKQMNYRAGVRADALRMARKDALDKGLSGAEYDNYLAEKVHEAFDDAFSTVKDVEAGRAHNVGQGMKQKAVQHARYTSFTNDLEYGIGQTLRQAAARHTSVRLIMPFIRTPVNLVRFAWQRTPGLNKWQRQMVEDLEAGGTRAASAKGRNDVGAALYGAGIMLALNGRLTGGGPSDPKLNGQWREVFQPYSINVGGKWINYQRIEPMATALGLIADFGESVAEMGEEDAMTMSYALIAAMSESMVSKTFLQGLSDFFAGAASGNAWSVQKTMDEMALSFVVPSAARQINNAMDPKLRETRHILDKLQARIPGWSKSLPPKKNIFGEDVVRPGISFGRVFNPFTFMTPPEDAHLRRELLMLGEALPMPNPKLFSGNLDMEDPKWAEEGHPPPYTRMLEMMGDGSVGPPLKDVIFRIVKDPGWDNMTSGNPDFPGGSKMEVVSTMIQAYVDAARAKLLTEPAYEKYRNEYIRLTGAKGEALLSNEQKMFDRLK